MADFKTKNLEEEIIRLLKEKDRHINNLLILKSSFSIIDDMFLKEIENKENTGLFMTIKRFLFSELGFEEKMIDPRKISHFIEDIMDPFGTQDKLIEEERKKRQLEEKTLKEEEEKNKQQEYIENKRKYKLEKKKQQQEEKEREILLGLFKNNKKIVDNIYDKLETGEIYKEIDEFMIEPNLGIYNKKKIGEIIKLHGENTMMHIDSDDKMSRSNSSNSLIDFNVISEEQDDED